MLTAVGKVLNYRLDSWIDRGLVLQKFMDWVSSFETVWFLWGNKYTLTTSSRRDNIHDVVF